MRLILLSIPDALAHQSQAAVPARQRSWLVTRFPDRELADCADAIAKACRSANQDQNLSTEIEEWQAFEDGMGE